MPVSRPPHCRAICEAHYRLTLGSMSVPYPCRDSSLFRASRIYREARYSVLQASRSSRFPLVERVCQRRWIRPAYAYQDADVGSTVCSHLPVVPTSKPVGLGFKQCSLRHTRLALTTRRVGDFLLRGFPRMLWSPSSFEVWGKRGVHGAFHQLQQLVLRSSFAADAAHP